MEKLFKLKITDADGETKVDIYAKNFNEATFKARKKIGFRGDVLYEWENQFCKENLTSPTKNKRQ